VKGQDMTISASDASRIAVLETKMEAVIHDLQGVKEDVKVGFDKTNGLVNALVQRVEIAIESTKPIKFVLSIAATVLATTLVNTWFATLLKK
jgi:uncharacterized protein (DUF697 family)